MSETQTTLEPLERSKTLEQLLAEIVKLQEETDGFRLERLETQQRHAAEIDQLQAERDGYLDELNTDAMTNVMSARGMYQALDNLQTMLLGDPSDWHWRAQNETERESSDEPITDVEIVMFDLNHFKKLNDKYGHTSGDAALATFADILKASFRDSDIIARSATAGDEFIIIAPVSAEDEGFAEETVRDKILASIQDIRDLHDDESIFSGPEWTEYFGTSFGVACLELTPGMDLRAGIKKAFDVADQRMRDNKGDNAR